MNNELKKKINIIINDTKAEFLGFDILYKGEFINLIKEYYKLPDDRIITRERIVKNNNKQAVIIVARTQDNKYILVVQNRINKMTTIEFPSGYVEEGENIIEASARELLEETGYTSNDFIQIDSYYTQIGIDSSIVNIVVANNCIKTNKQNLGKNEYINYYEFTFQELEELFNNNIINSVGNKLAFYKLSSINLNDKKYVKKINIR